jgi:hypothetical protein
MANPSGTELQSLLALRWPPVAVSFPAERPQDVDRVAAAAFEKFHQSRLAS